MGEWRRFLETQEVTNLCCASHLPPADTLRSQGTSLLTAGLRKGDFQWNLESFSSGLTDLLATQPQLHSSAVLVAWVLQGSAPGMG